MITYSIDAERKLVVTIISGVLNLEQIHAHLDRLKGDPAFRSDFNQLLDLRHVTHVDIDFTRATGARRSNRLRTYIEARRTRRSAGGIPTMGCPATLLAYPYSGTVCLCSGGIVFAAAARSIGSPRPECLAKRWLPAPQVLHPYPDARFAATHPR